MDEALGCLGELLSEFGPFLFIAALVSGAVWVIFEPATWVVVVTFIGTWLSLHAVAAIARSS